MPPLTGAGATSLSTSRARRRRYPPAVKWRVETLENAAAAFRARRFVQALCDIAAFGVPQAHGVRPRDGLPVPRRATPAACSPRTGDPTCISFLNHHFPGRHSATGARALSSATCVRVIPDRHYEPAPLRPAAMRAARHERLRPAQRLAGAPAIPAEHGVGASASVSIVHGRRALGPDRLPPRDAALPRLRGAHAPAAPWPAGLTRQIKAKHEAAGYRERLAPRQLRRIDRAPCSARDPALWTNALRQRISMTSSACCARDGVAVVRGHASCVLRRRRPPGRPPRFAALPTGWPTAAAAPSWQRTACPSCIRRPRPIQTIASGLLVPTCSTRTSPDRADVVRVPSTSRWSTGPAIPHQPASLGPHNGALTPRASFDAWSEIVRGRARDVDHASQIAAAARLHTDICPRTRQNWRVRELNRRLTR